MLIMQFYESVLPTLMFVAVIVQCVVAVKSLHLQQSIKEDTLSIAEKEKKAKLNALKSIPDAWDDDKITIQIFAIIKKAIERRQPYGLTVDSEKIFNTVTRMLNKKSKK